MKSEQDTAWILKAAHFAAVKHRDQRRKNGDIPYINHPLAVANLLSEVGGVTDVPTLVAAILHDTVEDTATTHAELKAEFSDKIASIVAEVTDDKALAKVERKRHQVEHAKHISAEARLVKLGDKLYNLRDLATKPPPTWDLERIQGYFCWAYHVLQSVGNVNAPLWAELEKLFASEFSYKGKSYPVVADEEEQRQARLEEYYRQMSAPGV